MPTHRQRWNGVAPADVSRIYNEKPCPALEYELRADRATHRTTACDWGVSSSPPRRLDTPTSARSPRRRSA
jgi:hypothetical protein